MSKLPAVFNVLLDVSVSAKVATAFNLRGQSALAVELPAGMESSLMYIRAGFDPTTLPHVYRTDGTQYEVTLSSGVHCFIPLDDLPYLGVAKWIELEFSTTEAADTTLRVFAI